MSKGMLFIVKVNAKIVEVKVIGSGEWRMAGPADFITNFVEPFGSQNCIYD